MKIRIFLPWQSYMIICSYRRPYPGGSVTLPSIACLHYSSYIYNFLFMCYFSFNCFCWLRWLWLRPMLTTMAASPLFHQYSHISLPLLYPPSHPHPPIFVFHSMPMPRVAEQAGMCVCVCVCTSIPIFRSQKLSTISHFTW